MSIWPNIVLRNKVFSNKGLARNLSMKNWIDETSVFENVAIWV